MKTDYELVEIINQVFGESEMSDEELSKLLHVLEEECPGITNALFGNDGRYSPLEAIAKAREDFRIFSSGAGGTTLIHPHASDKTKGR